MAVCHAVPCDFVASYPSGCVMSVLFGLVTCREMCLSLIILKDWGVFVSPAWAKLSSQHKSAKDLSLINKTNRWSLYSPIAQARHNKEVVLFICLSFPINFPISSPLSEPPSRHHITLRPFLDANGALTSSVSASLSSGEVEQRQAGGLWGKSILII